MKKILLFLCFISLLSQNICSQESKFDSENRLLLTDDVSVNDLIMIKDINDIEHIFHFLVNYKDFIFVDKFEEDDVNKYVFSKESNLIKINHFYKDMGDSIFEKYVIFYEVRGRKEYEYFMESLEFSDYSLSNESTTNDGFPLYIWRNEEDYIFKYRYIMIEDKNSLYIISPMRFKKSVRLKNPSEW